MPTSVIDAQTVFDQVIADRNLTPNNSYDGNDVGEAIISVNRLAGGIQQSNFSGNSFKVTNTGDKKIIAVLYDATNAVLTDAVFDATGLAGDGAAKGVEINTPGGTGVFSYATNGSGATDPFEAADPTGGGSDGYEGLLIQFFENADGGFTENETLGFSLDMDPNSIAGQDKGGVNGVDTLSVPSWDVGGVSGAELSGMKIYVLFDDHTIAEGSLIGDGSNAGGQALVSQDQDRSGKTVSLTVNGVTPDNQGAYDGETAPTVVVQGDAGDWVRVVAVKGFNPVQLPNNATTGQTAVVNEVASRLATDPFQSSNIASIEVVDIQLTSNNPQDISNQFASWFNQDPFNDDTEFNLGFVAAVIEDPSESTNLANFADGDTPFSSLTIGEATAPIHILLDDLPPPPPPPAPPAIGYFEGIEGNGNNFRFKVQIEDPRTLNGNGGTTPGGKWTYVDTPDDDTPGNNGNQSGFQGVTGLGPDAPDGYYVYGGETNLGINGVIASEVLEYQILIPENELGVYTFEFRVSRDGAPAGDQQNDLWLNFKASGTNESISQYLVEENDEPEPLNQGYVKVFGGPNNGNWGNTSNVDGAPGNFQAQIDVKEAGLYTVQIAGRSQGYHVDYWELYKGNNPGNGASNSPFVQGDATITPIAPSNVTESGDDGDTTVSFTLSANAAGVADEVEITYDETVNGVTTRKTTTVTFANSEATLNVLVPNDDDDDGSDTASIALVSSGTDGFITADGTVTATILEDDGEPVAPGQALYRINAGGEQVAVNDGGPAWGADTVANPDQYLATTDNRVDTNNKGLADTGATGVPLAVMETARSSNQPFAYNIPIADLGLSIDDEVTINFYIDELFFEAPGGRSFDIEVEGSIPPELDEIDPVGDFSGVGAVLSYTVGLSDAVLNISVQQGSVNNPILNGLEIVAVDGGSGDATISLLAGQDAVETGDDGSTSLSFGLSASGAFSGAVTLSYSYTINNGAAIVVTDAPVSFVNGAASLSVDVPNDDIANGAETVALTITDIATPGFAIGNNAASASVTEDDAGAGRTILFRINAAGEQVAASDGGPNWVEDTSANPSAFTVVNAENIDTTDATSFSNNGALAPDAVYDTARSGNSTAGNNNNPFSYEFQVANGTYEVNLFFVNSFFQNPGERVFDVAIEDTVPNNLDELDISAEFGNGVGVRVSNVVEVTDGVLEIDFLKGDGNQNPVVNAIEIVALSDQTGTVISVISDGDVLETGDDGDTAVSFSLSASDAAFGETVDVTYTVSIAGGAAQEVTETVTFAGGVASLSPISVANDDENDGPDAVEVALVSVTGEDVVVSTVPATASVTEDDLPPPALGAVFTISGVSTFGGNSLVIENTSEEGVKLTQVVYDIGTAVLSLGLDTETEFLGATFDPTGTAGDSLAKGLEFSSNSVGLLASEGVVAGNSGEFSGPFHFQNQLPGGDGGADGGFQFMTLNFDNFDASESFSFAVDIDPQSIQGATGAGDAGAVAGVELAGMTITATFEDAQGNEFVRTGQLVPTGGTTAQLVFTDDELAPAPVLEIVGLTDASTRRVIDPDTTQAIEVSGVQPGDTVTLYVFDASGYEKNGVNGSETVPFDEFHANTIDGGQDSTAQQTLTATADGAGVASFQVTLNNVVGDDPATVDELFFFSAAVTNGQGAATSLLSTPAELKIGEPPITALLSIAAPDPAPVEAGDDETTTTVEFPLTLDDGFTGQATVQYTLDPLQVVVEQVIDFVEGAGVLSIEVDNDDLANGAETVSVTLNGVILTGAAVDAAAAAASTTVAEDDFAPVAVDDPDATTDFETPLTFNPAANDTDADDPGALTVTAVSNVSGGAQVTPSAGGVTVTPNAGFSGVVTFTYTVSDPGGNTDTGVATVTVGAEPDLPPTVTLSNLQDVDEDADTSGRIKVADILVEDDAVSTVVLAASVGFEIDGAELFLSAGAELDFETLSALPVTVTATDDAGTDEASASIQINDVEEAVVVDDEEEVTVTEDTSSLDLGPEGQTETTVTADADDISDVPITGFGPEDEIVINGVSEGTIVSVANASTVVGIDTDGDGEADLFVTLEGGDYEIPGAFDVDDFNLDVSDGTATLTVLEQPDVTISIDDPEIDEDAAGDGDTGTVTVVFTLTASPAVDGLVTVITSGALAGAQEVTFVGGTGTLSVSVDQDDVANGDDAVTVTLESASSATLINDFFIAAGGDAIGSGVVTEDDFAPTPAADTETTGFQTPITFNPAANDTDADDETSALTVTAVSNVSAGASVSVEDGLVTVTPDDGFEGSVTFDYTVVDPGGNSATGTATVTVGDEPQLVLSISGPDEVVESGDEGATTADFTVTLDDAGFDGTLDIDVLIVSGATNSEATFTGVSFQNGAGTLSNLSVAANDDVFDGPDAFEVALIGASIVSGPPGAVAISPSQGSAFGVVTEDEAAPPIVPVDDGGFSTPTEQTVFIRFEDLLANDTGGAGGLEIAEITNTPHPTVDGGFFSDNGALFTLWNDTAPVFDVADATQFLYGPPPASTIDGEVVAFTGVDTFSYKVKDQDGSISDGEATVTVTTAPDVVEDRGTTDDVVVGTDLSERLFGEFGDDDIFGLDGDDIVFGFTGDDRISGGAGRDLLDGEFGSDIIVGGAGLDYLYGDGFSGVDEFGAPIPQQPLDGQTAEDMEDILYGGEGLDALFGGVGNDTFVLTSNSDEEQIFDWNEGDQIAVQGASDLNDLMITTDEGTNNVRIILDGTDGSDSMLIVTADEIELDANDFDFTFDFSQITFA